MYAELMGNHKKHRIKSQCDNKIDVELGTGIHAEGGGGRQTPWKYQDAKGNWHTTSGMPARPFLRPALENHIKEYQETVEAILRDMP